MDNKETILQVKDLSVDFKVDRKTILHAVRNVSFDVHKGETLGIVGESGCGKSVTCMSILKLEPERTTMYPTGEILFKGQDLLKVSTKDMKDIRGDKISMIFQEPMTALNPLYTIGDQMREALRVHNKGMSKAEANDICLDMLNKVKIPNPARIMESYTYTLSGGMLQRIMIAMAMMAKPDLLICDEPTTALDVTIQAQVLDLMNQLKEENDTSIIFITHDLGVISEMADRVVVMYGGKVCEESSISDLFYDARHPYTKGLIGSHPSPDFTGKRLPVIPGNVPSLKDMPTGCPFNNRCTYVCDKCKEVFPERMEISENHFVSCFYEKGVE